MDVSVLPYLEPYRMQHWNLISVCNPATSDSPEDMGKLLGAAEKNKLYNRTQDWSVIG